MARSSTIPAALPALVATFRASPGLAKPVAVRDGPVVTSSGAPDAVVVGWTGIEGDELAVEVTNTAADLGDVSAEEQYSIRCAALSRKGAPDPETAIATARARAYELLDACAAQLAADRKLGGAVIHARIGSHTLSYSPAEKGLMAAVEFMVDVRAFTGR